MTDGEEESANPTCLVAEGLMIFRNMHKPSLIFKDGFLFFSEHQHRIFVQPKLSGDTLQSFLFRYRGIEKDLRSSPGYAQQQ